MRTIEEIPTVEILRDIADTEREILTLMREETGYRLIGDKLSLFRANAKNREVKERKAFIEKLLNILSCRNEKEE